MPALLFSDTLSPLAEMLPPPTPSMMLPPLLLMLPLLLLSRHCFRVFRASSLHVFIFRQPFLIISLSPFSDAISFIFATPIISLRLRHDMLPCHVTLYFLPMLTPIYYFLSPLFR